MPVLKQGQHLGRYRIARYLGHGVSGESYATDDMALQRTVALKIIHPWATLPEAARRQFFREMHTSSLLNHPSLAAYLDYGESDNKLYIARRFIRHGSLLGEEGRSWFKPPLPVRAALYYVHQLAQALHFIHRHGYAHGALTLTNILVQHSPASKPAEDTVAFVIADAGLAHFVRRFGQPQNRLLPITAAPEQFDKQLSAASDQYALAVLLYFWLAGQPPFLGSPDEIEQLKRTGNPTPLTSLNPGVTLEQEMLIGRALAVSSKDRFPSILGFADAMLTTLPTSDSTSQTEFLQRPQPTIPKTDPLLHAEPDLFLRAEHEQPPELAPALVSAQPHTQFATGTSSREANTAMINLLDIPSTEPSLVINYQPQPQPTPTPSPIPEPAPEPLPQPAPEPLPQPTPEPLPQPTPEPAPQPAPEPLPAPAPEPLPQPAPDVFQPLPQTATEPAPLPQTEPSGQEGTGDNPVVSDEQTSPVALSPRLIIEFAGHGNAHEFLIKQDEILIGRAGSDDILLNLDTSTSRHHALLRQEHGQYVIYDQRSTNGVFVNGQKLAEETGCSLSDGDAITIGNYELLFRDGAAS